MSDCVPSVRGLWVYFLDGIFRVVVGIFGCRRPLKISAKVSSTLFVGHIVVTQVIINAAAIVVANATPGLFCVDTCELGAVCSLRVGQGRTTAVFPEQDKNSGPGLSRCRLLVLFLSPQDFLQVTVNHHSLSGCVR